jgi:hypothetical protein
MSTATFCDYGMYLLNIDALQVGENPKYLKKPGDNDNDNHNI